jgi:hypothetical protein
MTDPISQTKQSIDRLTAFVEQSPWRGLYYDRLQNLKAQVDQPCVLAIAGRVKAGKSSFLNAILGKDLAKVGTTETTATINVFRKGTPPDPAKPVLVIWKNGHQTYESKEFLDALQGNDKATLQKAEGIKRLEFLLSDPLFDEVTLVDTPGTDAIVGEDGEGHQKITEEFFNLRKQHSEETKEQTDNADAVIYLIGQVANASMQGFMQEFQTATSGGSSAMNAIGVMAKVDMSDEIIRQRDELAASIAQKMQHELNTVVPVSAGIWRALDELRNNNKLEWMQQKLKSLPEEGFAYLMQSEKHYLSTSSIFDKIFSTSKIPAISVDERRALKADLPWRVFVVISNYLYKNPYEEAVSKLTEISGVNRVMEIIQKHFFNRGKLLRCYRISNELRAILNDMERNRLYELGKEVRSRKEFEEFILSHPMARNNNTTAQKLLSFMKSYLKTEQEMNQISVQIIDELIPGVENLQLKLQKTDDQFRALQLIEQNIQLFSQEEQDELFALFGMYGNSNLALDEDTRGRRQQYWNLELNRSRSKDRRLVAQYAISAYGSE